MEASLSVYSLASHLWGQQNHIVSKTEQIAFDMRRIVAEERIGHPAFALFADFCKALAPANFFKEAALFLAHFNQINFLVGAW